MKKLQKELKKALEQNNSAIRSRKHLEQLNKRLTEEYKRNDKLAKQLEKEDKDYEKLQGLSLKGLFYSILGNKRKQMEREKQEYLEASLRFDESRKSIEMMEFEAGVLEEKLDHLGNIEKKVKRLKKEREQFLIREGGDSGKKLIKIAKTIDLLGRDEQEVKEALDVADHTVEILAHMIRLLGRARNWGNWDMMGGKSMSTLIKHSNIDKARNLAHKARFHLLQFENELRDIYADVDSLGLTLQTDTFVRFTDIFFDNLISDWIVQQRIRNSIASVRSVHDRVIRMKATLAARQKSLKAQTRKLTKEREKILSE